MFFAFVFLKKLATFQHELTHNWFVIVSVNKSEDVDWHSLKAHIFAEIADFYASGKVYWRKERLFGVEWKCF
jgi:hypothetical protein